MTNTDDTTHTMSHTQEPWIYEMDRSVSHIFSPDSTGDNPYGTYIAEIANGEDVGEFSPYEVHEANARRIVAAVNACEGISTPALEDGVIKELLAALHGCLLVLDDNSNGHGPTKEQAVSQAREAIAKAFPQL